MRHGMVLAGGLGTRLRPFTTVLPKPLIPLGTETILERVLRGMRDGGLSSVTICLGYLGYLVEAVIGDGSRLGMTITYTREDEPLGTAGALALLPTPVGEDDILLVVNGDTLTTLDFGAELDWFDKSGATAAMICVEREVKIDYGVVHADEAGRLLGIEEKPTTRNTLSTGINLLRGRALGYLPAGRYDMPDLLMKLVAAGEPVLARTSNSLWMDLGRAEDLIAANHLLDEGRI
ncbi:MAG: nucleotidyltransferase family protein [Candidatus Nanopelagicales bacterium]